jgi:hypothetical protein
VYECRVLRGFLKEKDKEEEELTLKLYKISIVGSVSAKITSSSLWHRKITRLQ